MEKLLAFLLAHSVYKVSLTFLNVQDGLSDKIIRVPREDFNLHLAAEGNTHTHGWKHAVVLKLNQNSVSRQRPCVHEEERQRDRGALWDVQSSSYVTVKLKETARERPEVNHVLFKVRVFIIIEKDNKN